MNDQFSLDADGQPLQGRYGRANVIKTIEHALGLCRGMLADGDLNGREVDFLDLWIRNHHETLLAHPIGRILAARVARITADNIITEEELTDLKATLEELLGATVDADGVIDTATNLNSEVSPEVSGTIDFHGRNFVVTGKFAYGPRAAVEEQIVRRGGQLASSVSGKTHYIVIGTMGSRDWITSAFGTKLEKAHELNAAGASIRIIAEPVWVESLVIGG